MVPAMPEKTGFDKYLEQQMQDPEFAAEFWRRYNTLVYGNSVGIMSLPRRRFSRLRGFLATLLPLK